MFNYALARADMQIRSYTQRPGMQMSSIQGLDWPIGVNDDGTPGAVSIMDAGQQGCSLVVSGQCNDGEVSAVSERGAVN